MDALRGEVATPLPAGRYRVLATKGFEWTIDAAEVTVQSGRASAVELELRRVVHTNGRIGCDLHVHARPSFDSPVTPEDRVLSLVAAGIEMAVPTEHNIVGDYGPALATLDLERELLWVPGVEVTTYAPRLGHFGVFPYPPGNVPPYQQTTVAAILAAARRGDDENRRIVQLNHPLLPAGTGYLAMKRYKPGLPLPPGLRTDFDAMEVYNGYDLGAPERVDEVLLAYWDLLGRGLHMVATGSSDAHRIQYHWAGYPRTFVDVDPPPLAGRRPSPLDVVSALKHGRAVVSTGPVVDLDVMGARPGDELVTTADAVRARVKVAAAPWVDVSRLEVVVGGRVVRTVEVGRRTETIGPEPGALDEARARAVRWEGEIEVPLGPLGSAAAGMDGADGERTWIALVARGERPYDDLLPFMPVHPFAVTNPVWIRRDR
jgi:hypothetical protein